MPFESLSERFQLAFKKLRGKGKLSEEDVNEALKENKDATIFITPGGAVPNIWVDTKDSQKAASISK